MAPKKKQQQPRKKLPKFKKKYDSDDEEYREEGQVSDSQAMELEMDQLEKENILILSGHTISHEIFVCICQYVPVFPDIFFCLLVCKSWRAVIERQVFDAVSVLDLLEHANGTRVRVRISASELNYLAKVCPNVSKLIISVGDLQPFSARTLWGKQTFDLLKPWKYLEELHIFSEGKPTFSQLDYFTLPYLQKMVFYGFSLNNDHFESPLPHMQYSIVRPICIQSDTPKIVPDSVTVVQSLDVSKFDQFVTFCNYYLSMYTNLCI